METDGFMPRAGRDENETPPAEKRVVHAGPLALVMDGMDLRYVRLGDAEVLRRVYVAVRDPNWHTIPPLYSNVHTEVGPDAFTLSFDVEYIGNGIDLAGHGAVRGTPDGTITYTVTVSARTTFRANRLGFCVLHPMECAGRPCRVHHVDGSWEDGVFPRAILPHQPFGDFDTLNHEVRNGVWAQVQLSGDTFEMEDQRNWTDASFKTYSRPLRLPFPVEVARGTTFSQSVVLSLQGTLTAVSRSPGGTPLLEIDGSAEHSLPRLGVGMASHGLPLTGEEVARLRALQLAHVRVDLHLSAPGWDTTLGQAARQSGALGVPLEVALFLSDAAPRELAALARALAHHGPAVCRWLVFHTGETVTQASWVRLARGVLAAYQPEAPIGAGTNAYFAELNRARPDLAACDVVSFTLNPQVHAHDSASLTETLAAQAATVTSARGFCGDRPLAVSPVTLKPRFNPNATGPEPEPPSGVLPSQVDVRQMTLFGAAWTVGSIKYLAAGGAASVTYYETTGWRGVMEGQSGSPLPSAFPSFPGMVFPLYHVFAAVGALAGAAMLTCRASHPLQVDGLALRAGNHLRVLMANMSDESRGVRVQALTATTARAIHLDERSIHRATHDAAFWAGAGEVHRVEGGTLHLDLLPYAVVQIDIDGGAT